MFYANIYTSQPSCPYFCISEYVSKERHTLIHKCKSVVISKFSRFKLSDFVYNECIPCRSLYKIDKDTQTKTEYFSCIVSENDVQPGKIVVIKIYEVKEV
jgi:hypothetical protein